MATRVSAETACNVSTDALDDWSYCSASSVLVAFQCATVGIKCDKIFALSYFLYSYLPFSMKEKEQYLIQYQNINGRGNTREK